MFSKMKGSHHRSGRRLSAAAILACLAITAASSTPADAADKSLVNIRQVQVSDNDRVDILLDGRLDPAQIRTEFLNDIIQLSVSDASVYPAKISSVSAKSLSKIFIYQYAPRLVRVRLTVKGRAEAFQGRVQVKPSGRTLTISLNGGAVSDKVASSASQAQKPPAQSSSVSANVDAEERALLEKVLKSPVAKPAEKSGDSRAEAVAANSKSGDSNSQEPSAVRNGRRETRNEALTGRKETFSPWKMLASLAGVVLLLGAALLGLRKLAQSRSRDGALGRWVKKSLGRPEKVIEVVATHHLGPKKSIHMVKVAGRTLVLGVADDSINLITELNAAAAASAGAAAVTAPGEDDFLSTLGEQIAQESGRPQNLMNGTGATAAGPASYQPSYSAVRSGGTRDRIRSRLEGMKQL